MDFLLSFIRLIIAGILAHKADRGLATLANREHADGIAPTTVSFGWLPRMLAAALCGVMIPLALIVFWIAINRNMANGMWISALLFGAIAVWLGVTCCDIFVRRIEWDETQVRFRNLKTGFTVPWSDITGLEEKWHPPHIRIGFRNGTGFAISETMNNSRYFMRMVERRLGPDAPQGKRRRQRQRGKRR